ncbi:cytidine deaminase [Mesorhizobium sp.]|uniref:cytidine deaminase family protein n=1 Tax=Mesorhizobium sp. TaxID=1871066 RepID=UPI00120C045F|nr:cytidine deaminase [Mesorhizobium sp.]TIV59226.1 MAG: cytidine deaminase [Mesorhizobium sp.]
MEIDFRALTIAARAVADEMGCSEDCKAGGVGAALVSATGIIYTGLCIDTGSSLGFCAEHAAIADMLKHRETQIAGIVAVSCEGNILPPCGRCRELIRQVDPANWHTRVLVAENVVVPLSELLPYSQASEPSQLGASIPGEPSCVYPGT